jgi:hypothetical protein
MADTKISALTAASAAAAANEFAINEAGTSKKLTLQQIVDFLVKRAAGTTVAAGEYTTRLVLAANSSDITGLTLTTVMSITGVGVGRYYFRCQLVYQTSATTTGIGVAVNHTGTLTQFVVERRFSDNIATASSGAASEINTLAANAVYASQGSRTKNTLIGAVTISVDTANTDMITMIEGFFVVSVTGTLEIKLEAELASLVCRAMQGSFLELVKLS